MRKIFTTLTTILICCAMQNISAQVTAVWEPYVIHNYPTLEDADNNPNLFALDGYITWRLYAETTYGDIDTPDFIGALLGSEQVGTMQITFDCCPYQNQNFGLLYSAIQFSQFILDNDTTAYFDSWLTLGLEPAGEGSYFEFGSPPWVDDFENCQNLQIFDDSFNGSSFGTLPESVNGYANEDNLILLGQFTLPQGCQLIDGSFSLEVFPDGDFDLENVPVQTTVPPLNPCFNDPLIVSIQDSTEVLCFDACDGTATFDISGGSGDYTITSDEPGFTSDNMGFLSDLCAGVRTITFTDNLTTDNDGNNCSVTQTVEILQPDAPLEATFNLITNSACVNDSLGVVEFEVTGGTPYTVGDPYVGTTSYGVTYEFIAPNIVRFDSLSVEAGVQFSILDSNGCEVLFTENIGPVGALTVDSQVTEISCGGADDGEILLTPAGGQPNPTITWTSTVNNDLNPTNLEPGTYSVTVDDGDSCPVELEFTLEEPDPIVISNIVPEHIDCFGLCTGSVAFDVNGGDENYTESFIQNSSPINNGEFCVGDVTIEIRDGNNCFGSDTVSIAQGNELIFDANVTDILCPNSCDGIIAINTSGGTGTLTPSINPVIGFDVLSSSFLNVCENDYTLTLTDDLGCTKDTLVSMVEPEDFSATITSTNVTCSGLDDGSITVNVEGGSGDINVSVTDSPSNTTGIFEGLAPNVYTISGNDSQGCTFDLAETVEITEPAPLEITEISTTSPGCGGESTGAATLTIEGGTPGYLVGWNGSTPTAENATNLELAGGINSVQITDANLCVLNQEFEIIEPTPISYNAGIQNVGCTGMCNGQISITAQGVGDPIISFGQDFPLDGIILNNLCEGEYPFVIVDELGCELRDTITVEAEVISDIEYALFTTPVSCWNEGDGTATIAVTGGIPPITYDWRQNGVSIQNTETAIGLVEDFYSVTITDVQGCTFTEEVFIEPTEGCFYISNALTPNNDFFNDTWVIGGLEYFPEARVEVFNRWGQQVYESVGDYIEWDGKLNGNNLPVADYYYVITYDPSSPPLTGTVTIKY